jgi:hypothetical protein
MVDRPAEDPLERHRLVLRLGLSGLLLLSPLPLGSVRPGAVLAIELSAFALGLLAIWVVWRDSTALPRTTRRLLTLAAVIAAVGLIQLIPLPVSWIEILSSPSAELRQRTAAVVTEAAVSYAPCSLSPPATLDALLRFCSYVLIGLSAAVAVRSARHLKQVAIVIAAAGAFQALYGSAEYLSGNQQIFWYRKLYFLDEATGTFINRNHFAGFLAMALPFALALSLEGLRGLSRSRNWRERILRLAEAPGLTAIGASVAGGLIWIGLLLSYSRGGLAAALAATGLLALAVLRRKQFLLIALILLIPTAYLLTQGIRAPGARYITDEGILSGLSGRWTVWKSTTDMVLDFFPAGTGLGTFEHAFPLYRPPEILYLWNHAHNDWLQSLTEGGPAVFLAVFFGLIVILRATLIRWRRSNSVPLAVYGAAAAILAMALYSLTDFCLRIPSIAVLFAVILGLLSAALETPDSAHQREIPTISP